MDYKVKKSNTKIFKYDNMRSDLLAQNKIPEYLNTYRKSNDVVNLNTNSLWDEIFRDMGELSSQSPMTKDKIKEIFMQIPHKAVSILDLGIGQGFVEELLTKTNIKYGLTGIDISKHSISRAKKLFNGDFRARNVTEIDKIFKSLKFDVILALELLEHINPSEVFILYNKIYKLLKPDGKLILSIPINEGLKEMETNPNAHVRDYTFSIISAELELNGFKIIDKKFLYAFDKYYKLKKIISKVFINKWTPNSLIIVAKKVR